LPSFTPDSVPDLLPGPIPDEVVALLVPRYVENGETLEQLVARWPYSYRQIREALLDAGVTLRPAKIPVQPTPKGLVKAYENGRSLRQLANYYDLSYSQVRDMLLAEGVTLRGRGNSPAARMEPPSDKPFDALAYHLQNARIARLYNDGTPVEVLTATTGLSAPAVRVRLMQAGVTLRPCDTKT
jgi:uncharacterized protein (DUF433 family)